MPTLALAAGLLALVLSVLAIVLATIANRRHMATRRRTSASAAADGVPEDATPLPRSESPPSPAGEDEVHRELVLRQLRTRVDSLDEVVASLSSAVERLSDPVVSDESRLEALDAQVAAWPTRIAALEDDVTDLRDQHHGLAARSETTQGQVASVLGGLASVSEHVASVSEQAATASAEADSLSARLDALAEHAAEVLARTDRVAHGLHATDERVQEQGQLVAAQVQSLTGQVAALRDHVLTADPTALRHVAVVRYDAFADVGGRLSYSLAVLDDTDSGFVVTTLAGKAEVRTYVRAVSEGAGDGTLTAEEQQAIGAARQGAGSRP